ncbi:gamma carbonic anhydrase family protein [Xylophilus rhododendri]|uniref:Gamma carbonic anhydrase family protein n=1 Tax=Xylophilus rhododendri TaxID=2697032 RepID=A0A857J347_9BURK|nr:gamma carbonic anhydrase family protein [Xylophilus rhododendri]QHI97308.1 gamma carbonic anhydrase family protein [Xylophilus rhododendri]
MPLYELDGVRPRIAPTAWVADNAQIIGDVVLEDGASVWFGAVLRGDNATLTVGRGSNVQDNSVLHTDAGLPLTIGENVTIGHLVTLHGCSIGAGSLIGIGSVVLNHARIGERCLVGAGSLVTEGKEFADGSMIVGSPARSVRELTPEQIAGISRSAPGYVRNAQRFAAGLRRID